MSDMMQDAAPRPDAGTFSGEADGLRKAADEILKRRGENESVAV